MAPSSLTDPMRGRLSPLGLISLFLSFTEVVVGVAVTQTEGWVQVWLTAFVIAFPVGICAAFFAVLWKKPYVLYPPADFGANVDVATYVQHIGGGPAPRPIGDAIAEKLDVSLSTKRLTPVLEAILSAPTSDHGAAIERLAEFVKVEARSSVEDALIRIDSTPLLKGRGSSWDEPYDPDVPVWRFLDRIWLHLQPHVFAYSYGRHWLIRDATTGTVFRNIGRPWAESEGFQEDERTISEVGITSKARLEVMRP
jgi:hypothetical protein